jgi:hypothetical protein
MMNATDVESRLLGQPLPGELPAGEDWVMPSYGGFSIANLPAAIAALFGEDLPGALPALSRELWEGWAPGVRRVVLVVLDALGLRMLQEMWARGDGQAFSELAGAGRLVPLTSVFPSTTDAALLSLSTGRPPAEHGWLAYTMYLREMGMAANAIMLCPMWARQSDMLVDWGLDPESLVTVPTLASRLAAAGISTAAVLSSRFIGSGFTQMLYRGVSELRGHVHASDLWVHLRRLLASTRNDRALITAYWSGLDTLGHYYGHDTEMWQAEFRTVSHLLGSEFLARLPAEDREGTLLLVTADHGQIRIAPEAIVRASDDPELSRHLQVPVVGESRAAFLYPRPGRAPAIRDRLARAYPEWFAVLDSPAALDAGLMGKPVCDEAYARAGELLVLPRGLHALEHRELSVVLLGRHGGLTQEEMLVPLIGARLEAVG